MFCFKCKSFTFRVFCKKCEIDLKAIKCKKRYLNDDFYVISFYKYSDIKNLLSHKHFLSGYLIFNKLANYSISNFNFNVNNAIAIGLDDDTSSGYSHTAILLNAIKDKNIKIIYNAIGVERKITYKGKSLSYRKKNKRKYYIKKDLNQAVILVDDILTTGTSMLEAYNVLKKAKIPVLFGLVLADVKA